MNIQIVPVNISLQSPVCLRTAGDRRFLKKNCNDLLPRKCFSQTRMLSTLFYPNKMYLLLNWQIEAGALCQYVKHEGWNTEYQRREISQQLAASRSCCCQSRGG